MLDRRGDPGRPFYLGRGHVNAMLAENICVTTGAQEN